MIFASQHNFMCTYHGSMCFKLFKINVKALVGAFDHMKVLVGAFSVIVKPMDNQEYE